MPNADSLCSDTDAASGPHLVDSTMFWSRQGDAVRRYLLAKREGLQRAGWRHSIVAPADEFDIDEIDDLYNCGGVPLPASGGLRLPFRRNAARRLIEQQAPDLIEVGDPYRLAWAGLDAAQRLGVPAVAFCHRNVASLAARLGGATRARQSWSRRIAGAYLRRVYGQFDLVLAPSDALARELRELGLARVQRQSFGVDHALFHPARRDDGWRAALGVPATTRLLLYAGRFSADKNLPLLADVVRRLGPRYLLVAAGAGPVPPLGPQVQLLPPVDQPLELARLLASADCFVHAGERETSGLGALEAMACGTPVVVRAAGGLAEVVDGGAGLAVRSEHIDEWAEAITALFAAGRESWSTTVRARAADHAWEAVLPALLRRYQRLLDGGRSSALTTTSNRFSFGEVTQPAVLWRPSVPMAAPGKDATA